MGSGMVAGVPGLTPRDAAAAMALVTAATEQRRIVGFTSALRSGTEAAVRRLRRSRPRQRLDDVVNDGRDLPFGGTDCALPMLWALAKRGARSTRS